MKILKISIVQYLGKIFCPFPNYLKASLILLIISVASWSIEAQTNIALNKRATQSSNYTSSAGLPGAAVDGNTDGRWNSRSVTHTNGNGTKNPWWMVDLGKVYDISEIQIWNRTDCCKQRLSNMKILIKNTPRSDSWRRYVPSNHKYRQGERYPLSFKANARARYVLIQVVSPSGILSLAEVKVIGKEVVLTTTLSNYYSSATKIKSTDCKKEYPKSFFDPIHGGTCWTCLEGTVRTVFAVNSSRACEVKKSYKPATNHGKGGGFFGTDCAGGQFLDFNGNCYSCPSGYSRTIAAVNSSKACVKNAAAKFIRATKRGDTGCPDGSYKEAGACWTCPKGYIRSRKPINSEQACKIKT